MQMKYLEKAYLAGLDTYAVLANPMRPQAQVVDAYTAGQISFTRAVNLLTNGCGLTEHQAVDCLKGW